MTCSNKPNYTPNTLTEISPAKQWGIGRSSGYSFFNPQEFHALEDEVKVTFPINFTGKVTKNTSDNPNEAFGKANQMSHDNILRGSKFIAFPTATFNGAKLNEKELYQGAVIARSQQVNQGLMFLWEDFFKPDRRVNIGDTVTFSIDVRSNGEAIPTGAVAFKATPNFSQNYKVIEQPVGKEFTRITFQTTYLSDTWDKPKGWEEFWGTTNREVPHDGLIYWNKDNLCGFIQAKESVQLEFSRPMVSAIGSTSYMENSSDYAGNSVWDWNKAQNISLSNAGKLIPATKKEFFSMPEFIPVNVRTTGHMMLYKLTKKPYTIPTGQYGKIAYYSEANEDSVIRVDLFSDDTGQYGGFLYTKPFPPNAKFYRIMVTAASKESSDVYAQSSWDNWEEFKQEWYDAVANKLDGKTALGHSYMWREPATMAFELDIKGEVEKAFPKIFNGMTDEQIASRLREISYEIDSTMIARGSARNEELATLTFEKSDGSPETVHEFKSKGLTEFNYKGASQGYINSKGRIIANLFTKENNPTHVGVYPFVEVDYYGVSISVVLKASEMAEYGFDENNPKYILDSISQPTSRTEEGMAGSAVQVTHAYNIYGMVNESFPELFGDCYDFKDRIAKINSRINRFDFTFKPIAEDMTDGELINLVVEANDSIRDYTGNVPVNFERKLLLDNSKDLFVQPNGYLYIGFMRPASEDNIEIAAQSTLEFSFTMDRNYDQLKRVFRYNGMKQPWFLFVRDIQRSVLPPKINNLVSANKGSRRYSFGQSEGERRIVLNCFIKAPKEADIPYLMEELADYLDVGQTDIRFSDQPDRSYKIVLDGETGLTQETHVANFNISFILLDNYAFGNEVVEEFDIDGLSGQVPYITLENAGTANTYPQYLLEFDEEVGYVDLIGTDTSANVSIGRRPVDSTSDVKVDLKPRVFYSRFTLDDGANWRNMTAGELPSIEGQTSKLMGSLQRTKGLLYQTTWNYGSDKGGWHGNGVTANLSKNVNNFYMEASVAATGASKKGSSNAMFFVFYDTANTPIAYTKFGTRPTDGALDAYVSYGAEYKRSKVISGGKRWENFQGKVMVERKNNRWKLTVGQFKDRRYAPAPKASFNFGQSMLKDVTSTGWFDLDTATWDRPFARVGIFMGQFKDAPKKDHLSVRRLMVWENLEGSFEETPTGNPILFHKGDNVIIDSNSSQVYLNGELTPQLIDPMTDWFPVTKGENLIGINNFKGKLKVIYPERFK